MEYPYHRFLTAFEAKHGDVRWDNRPSNERAVLAIEGTSRWFFPAVLKNFRYFLGEGWNLYLIHTDYNEPFLTEQFGLWDIVRMKCTHPRINAQVFNTLCKDAELWKLVKEPKILVIEADTIACKPWSDEWFKWDMIGAPCGRDTLNGGLSLRDKAKMLEALVRFDGVLEDQQEDVFFTKALRLMGANLPDAYTAGQFCVESFYYSQPFGVHGTDKGYHPATVAEKIVRQIEF